MQYLQLTPESILPDISTLSPFRCVVIIEEVVSPKWRTQVSDWLVESGCSYMMAWGKECATWDESVDDASLREFDYGDIPQEKTVITTCHEGNTLLEVFWFSKHSAFHPEAEIRNTLLLHISNNNKMKKFLDEYAAV